MYTFKKCTSGPFNIGGRHSGLNLEPNVDTATYPIDLTEKEYNLIYNNRKKDRSGHPSGTLLDFGGRS